MPTAEAVQRPRPSFSGVLGLWIVALMTLVLHVSAGSADPGEPFKLRMSPAEVVRQVFSGDLGPEGGQNNAIVWKIRLPRAAACLLVGALLAIVGSAFQALFRNPLAEPYIVGVSSGSAVGGAAALAFGFAGWAAGLGLMACAFAGGAASLFLVLAIAGRRGQTDVQVLLLSGVVVGAMLSSVLSLLLFAAGQDANVILKWLLGSAATVMWDGVAVLFGVLILGVAALLPQARKLNALAVSEDAARRLGVDTAALKMTILLAGTAMAAAAVGTVGVIGFLGLVAPHIARRLLGVDWRWSLLGSGAIGAGLLVLADILAQRVVPGAELPVGAVTAILGAPFLLALMRRAEA